MIGESASRLRVEGGVTNLSSRGETFGVDNGGWVDSATDTIMGHLSRFATYAHGYGTADATYVDIYATYGLSTAFTLYQDANGDWYLDPSNIPGGGVECP